MARPTLRDVAKLAGVSLGTASQSLNNKPGVAPETRARVLNAARELGYQAQVRIAGPVNTTISTVGLLLKRSPQDPEINPFYSYILSGAERECQRHGISLMYANLEVDDYNRAENWPPMLLNQQVDGILVVGAFIEATIAQISQQTGTPLVLIDAYSLGQSFDSVVIDNVNGAYTAVSYLIEQGHRCIGLVGSEEHAYPSVRERRKGYTRALKHHAIECAFIEDGPLTREAGYEATIRLLERAPQVTGIFACNDEVAISVLNAALDMGREVPRDLSIIGFDDIDLAQEVNPPLTSMHVDKGLMGVMGVRHLRDRVENPGLPTLTTSISAQLMIRDSVAPLP
jgi:LacI family transcriptional regulator